MSVSGPCLAQPPPLYYWTPLCWYTTHYFYCPLQHPFLSRYFLTLLSNFSNFSHYTCCNVSPLIHGILYIFFHPMMSLPCPPFSSTLSHFPSLHCLTFITFETCFDLYILNFIIIYLLTVPFLLSKFLNVRPVLYQLWIWSLCWLSVLPKWTTLYFNWRIFIIIFES